MKENMVQENINERDANSKEMVQALVNLQNLTYIMKSFAEDIEQVTVNLKEDVEEKD